MKTDNPAVSVAPSAGALDAVYQMPGHLLRRMQQIAVSAFFDAIADTGPDITPVQYALMKAVQAHPGQDQARLAGAIAYDKTTIGGVIERLEQKQMLRRDISPSDRRSRIIHLTETGQRIISQLDPLVLQAQDAMLEGLSTDEKQVFIQLLTKAISSRNTVSRAPLRPLTADSLS